MIVTEIVEISKRQSRVIVDRESDFVLYRSEINRYGIKQDQELTQETYQKIMGELLPHRAKLRAMHLLQSRDYTEKQLRDKLQDGGYPEQIVIQALEYVKSFHYIDDLRYAEDYLKTFAGRRSLRRMEQDLQQKGIGKTVIEQAVREWQQQEGGQDELQMACELLKKKHYDREKCDRKELQRFYRFLLYRGFSAEIVQKALNTDWEE